MKNTDTPKAFFRSLEPAHQTLALFDLLPDVSFFVKDREGRFMAVNRRGCEYCGIVSAADAIGKTDYDFFPKPRADDYRKDDLEVMRTGSPIINRIESAPEGVSSPRLVTTSKLPLRDQSGRVVGIAGFSRQIERMQSGSANAMSEVVKHLHQNLASDISSEHLASMAGLSVSHFERRFRLAFGSSPRQYLIRIRIEHAARLLRETDQSITEIAHASGFYDHAHFSRSFRRIMNVAPSEYRKRVTSVE